MLRSIVVAIVALAPSIASSQELEIVNIRVGQGDATLIRGPETDGDRIDVLVDAGGLPSMSYDGGAVVGAVLAKHGIKELDFFVATHYDADHVGGVITGESNIHGKSFVLGKDQFVGDEGDDDGDGKEDWLDSQLTKMEPDPQELGKGDDVVVLKWIDRGDENPPLSQTYTKYKAMAESMGVRQSLDEQSEIDDFEIDLGGGARLTCIGGNGFVRDRDEAVENVNTENEKSLCFVLSFDKFHFLLCGDAIGRAHGQENAKVEAALGQYLTDNEIEIDILHVNHHGANNASELDFLTAIRPEIAVISLGNDNDHGHPHAETLKRLVAAGVYRIYQTSWGTTKGAMDEEVRRHQAIFQGDVHVRTDGKRYTISTSRTFDTDE